MGLVRGQQQAWPRASILNALGVAGHRPLGAAGRDTVSDVLAASDAAVISRFVMAEMHGCCPTRGCGWSSMRATACLIPTPHVLGGSALFPTTPLGAADNDSASL